LFYLPVLSLFVCARRPCSAFSTLSLPDALPIFLHRVRARRRRGRGAHADGLDLAEPRHGLHRRRVPRGRRCRPCRGSARSSPSADRKSTRLNSSHVKISYAVFCLKKKKKHIISK